MIIDDVASAITNHQKTCIALTRSREHLEIILRSFPSPTVEAHAAKARDELNNALGWLDLLVGDLNSAEIALTEDPPFTPDRSSRG